MYGSRGRGYLRSSGSIVGVVLGRNQSKVDTQTKSKSENNDKDNDTADPLELSCTTGMLDTLSELDVGSLCVGLDVLRLLLGLLNEWLLDSDLLGKVLEELVEFEESLFDLLDVVVTGADGTEGGGSSALTV